MAVVRTLAASFADATANTIYAHSCVVNVVEVQPHPQQANEVYVQLFDSATATPGVTTPNAVVPVLPISKIGAGTPSNSDATAKGGLKKRKFIFPGGLYFTTGCQIACTTTPTGGTAATTTSLPGAVNVYFTPKA